MHYIFFIRQYIYIYTHRIEYQGYPAHITPLCVRILPAVELFHYSPIYNVSSAAIYSLYTNIPQHVDHLFIAL